MEKFIADFLILRNNKSFCKSYVIYIDIILSCFNLNDNCFFRNPFKSIVEI